MTSSFFSYSPKTTSINYPWPADVTAVERIALSAQGDLQRVLSAFFARPISIALVYSNTNSYDTPDSPGIPLTLPNPAIIAAASDTSPLIQTRQVHLQCSGKIVCTATSTVRMTSPWCAHLFLEEKYAIGQMFSRMEKVPAFELLAVGLGPVDGGSGMDSQSDSYLGHYRRHNQLWRRYRLFVPDFECEILEVFPSRDMFVGGDRWLDEKSWARGPVPGVSVKEVYPQIGVVRPPAPLTLFLGFCFLLMLAFELFVYFTGQSPFCQAVYL
ncbi:hypothetical protein BDZ94DRAFT_1238413 [Collybia nuda]|uniref:Uncharacterized protein n=1 Tax=Collybia nuda TaxID=64659 RepID=A0A9P5Y0S1_9AGAR|nr:hypothetical protein BDZ94DRAFT_1238413 [Collybia nuda]